MQGLFKAVLLTVSSSFSSLPKVTRCSSRKAAGHHRRVSGSLCVHMLTVMPSALCSMDSSIHIFVRSKPGKADRYAAANGFAFLPTSLAAQENRLFGAGWPPGSDLSAVQVHLSDG